MITDEQWATFARYVKPNATIEYEESVWNGEAWVSRKEEGFLLESFPFSLDLERIDCEEAHVEHFGHRIFNGEGRLSIGFVEQLRAQLCNGAEEMYIPPREMRYWVKGEFLEFDDVIALGDAS